MQGIAIESPAMGAEAEESSTQEEENFVSLVGTSQTRQSVVKASHNKVGMLHQIKRFVKDGLSHTSSSQCLRVAELSWDSY